MAFKVDILTPSSVVARGVDASELFVPTVRGEINILPEHTHIVTKLGTGILRIKSSSGEKQYSMTTGICKLLGDRITILSTVTEEGSTIDLSRAEKAFKIAAGKLNDSSSLDDAGLEKYRRKLTRADMRIKLARSVKGL